MAATNVAFLWEAYDPEEMDKSVLQVNDLFVITKGMIVLWTFGGAAHSLFDLFAWNIKAMRAAIPGAGGELTAWPIVARIVVVIF